MRPSRAQHSRRLGRLDVQLCSDPEIPTNNAKTNAIAINKGTWKSGKMERNLEIVSGSEAALQSYQLHDCNVPVGAHSSHAKR